MIRDLDGAPAAHRRSTLPAVVSTFLAVAAIAAWLVIATPRSIASTAPASAPATVAVVAAPIATPIPAASFDATTAFQFKLVGCWPGGTQHLVVGDQVVLLAQLPGAACLNTRRLSYER
ncbi:MAG TPA: hypothetical protein VEU77_13170 [Candidatus Acidoferrales bacterium]|nr:hypothetical protein [Candidatus Acidoferrales bacterium]